MTRSLPRGVELISMAADMAKRLAEGSDTEPELDALLADTDALSEDMQHKLSAYWYLVETLRAESEAETAKAQPFLKAGSAHLAEAKRLNNTAEQIRGRALELQVALGQMSGQTDVRLEDGRLSFVRVSKSARLVLDDNAVDKLPPEYLTLVPAKPLIKQALKAGEEIPGARMETSESTSLQLSTRKAKGE